jgi:hypothetical protein
MLADALKTLAGTKVVDADGAVEVIELLPPATDAQIRALEAALPGPLPDEIRAALAVTAGLANGPLESFSILDLEGSDSRRYFRTRTRSRTTATATTGCSTYCLTRPIGDPCSTPATIPR